MAAKKMIPKTVLDAARVRAAFLLVPIDRYVEAALEDFKPDASAIDRMSKPRRRRRRA